MQIQPMYCLYCRRIFSTPEATPGLREAMTCPECGAAELGHGPRTPKELEREHLSKFSGVVILADALAVAGVKVHAFGRGSCWPDVDVLLHRGTFVAVVGQRHTLVLLDAPKGDDDVWRIRVAVRVDGTGESAQPSVLRTIHDTEIAPGLRAEGFAHEDLVCAANLVGSYRAIWARTVGNPAAVAAFVHAVGGLNTTVDADAFLWKHSFGDLREMTAFASRLPPGVYVTQLTPWGISLAAPDRRDLGCIDGEGRGRIYVYLVLPYGFGARAARKRAVEALSWFEANHADAWTEQGFTEASSEGHAPLGSGNHRRWAIRLVLRFAVGKGAAAVLAWAADRGVIEFGG